ncbi:Glycerol-3-phosphate acyltransferase [Thermodesulfobacterium geofontis OPF15]|uniref:Glycerol-3-phosphate acyltransferase n=1 Tax=Thermodesulfobacterium geofontis (strain OPF15) TaxID=795359 RepID=F8C2P0_THEGP|nr:glycerol-3-phosphate 1-O-acyltransferase PlsY [Thermodesulfobacterium geofontis]AEH23441.1 Glycerol-3-phosphate acyltransferase [Thermodesulfobacterium geofontis OPF15]
MSNLIFLFFLSYLLGSIPFALIVSLPQGVDPRKEGSKNPGATNVARLLGKKWGIITFLGDSLKGVFALFIAYLFLEKIPYPKELVLAGTAFFAVLGHLFSIFLKFKGGKGVATTIGVFLVLAPKAMLISLIIFFIAVFISNYVSVGSLLATALLPLNIFLMNYPSEYIICSFFLAILIWIKHKDNIKRLLKGEEKTWRKIKK